MADSENFDLVIVGAGLVGATLGCLLAEHSFTRGLRIALLDAGSEPGIFKEDDFDPRVVALTRASQQVLESIGVWEQVVSQRACAYREMKVWDGEGTGRIHFDSREIRQPNLGHIVENSLLLRALLDKISLHGNITLLRGEKLEAISETEEGQIVKLESGRQLESTLIVGADGAHSKVRSLAGIETREWSYGQQAIVCTVKTRVSHSHCARQIFLASGPLAFLPLQLSSIANEDGEHYSSIVWSATDEIASELMQKGDKDFAEHLEKAFESTLGEIESVSKRYAFPLRQRHAVNYCMPGVALVGDAAHTIHPLAGQGVNLGFLDVKVLAEELVRAMERQIPLSDFSVLSRYQRQRKPHNLAMMAVMESFKRVFGSDDMHVNIARNFGLNVANTLPAIKKVLMQKALVVS